MNMMAELVLCCFRNQSLDQTQNISLATLLGLSTIGSEVAAQLMEASLVQALGLVTAAFPQCVSTY